MQAHRPLKLFLLGTPYAVMPDKSVLTIENHQMIQLLALLMLNPRKMYLRSELCELFYPEHLEKQAEQNLRQMIHRLRKMLHDQENDPILIGEPLTLRLSDQYSYWVDIGEFNTLVQDVQKHSHRRLTACRACMNNLEQAAALHQNEFMSGIYFRGPLEEWVFTQRTAILQKMIFVLRTLATYFLQHGQWLRSQDYVDRWLMLDALDEEAAALQMKLSTLQGKRTFALQFYQRFTSLMHSRLDIGPSEEMFALSQSIQDGTAFAETFAQPLRTGHRVIKPFVTDNKVFGEFRHLQIPFVARTAEVKNILERLADNSTRLFTITGMGGVGKTRLALHIAKLDAENWLNGVAVIYMQDGDDFYKNLLHALNKPLHMDRAFDAQVYAHLKDEEMLLVLDHLDEMPDAKYILKMLLFQLPKIKVIVTSRERLGIAGEIIIQLHGLPYPADTSTLTSDRTPAAVELFYMSAKSLYPLITFSEHDLPCIKEICRLLYGSPFAIVLASMWVQTLSCEQIASSIRQNKDFLKDILKYLPEGQGSIRTVFNLVWQQLDSFAQRFLHRLAHINEPFTLLEAQSDYNIPPEYVIALLDKSLLEVVESKYLQVHPLFRSFVLEEHAYEK